MTAEEAVAGFVRDGDVVAVGGTNHARTPMALLVEILRQRRTGLAMSRPLTCFEAELFIATGMADSVLTSWVGIGHGWGLAQVLREYVESGRVDYEEWSHLGLGLRYRAGAMGVPFLPTYSMLGSDLGRRLQLVEATCPYTGQELTAVPSLNPDVALIHVQRADAYGNAQIDGYELMDGDVARAARRLVVSTEELVATDDPAPRPGAHRDPGVRRRRGGGAADGCLSRTSATATTSPTRRRSPSTWSACVRHGSDGAREYVAELVAHADHDAFLASVAPERLAALRRDAEGMMPQ